MIVNISREVFSPGKGPAGPSDANIGRVERAVFHSRPFIHGAFVETADASRVSNSTPISGETLGEIEFVSGAGVDGAVRSASRAFPAWRDLSPGERKAVLVDVSQAVAEHAEELAILDAVDVGKPFEIALAIDVDDVVQTFRWYAELVDKLHGSVAPTPTIDLLLRFPLGVVGAIVPWNYPLMIGIWKIAPILAAGNCAVWKPSEHSPLSALRFAEIAHEAGLPKGVLNVIPGTGELAGDALVRHPDVSSIAFTGSTEVGRAVMRSSTESGLKPVSLECGGKSASVVWRDADLELAAEGIAGGVFYNAGQSCNAPTRALVERSVADRFIEHMVEQASQLRPDNPMAEDTQVGCIVSADQLSRIGRYVEGAIEQGAEVVTGGEPRFAGSGGYYFEPTILASVRNDMTVSQEEVFGPVLPVEIVDDLNEAIESANATPYGLWGSVWTRSLDVAATAARGIEAGTVAINNAFGGDHTTPMGGVKLSGFGRDRGIEALRKYTYVKHVHMNV